ncbi:MAG: parallel beta-helix domain-containing protein [Pseudomonadota bacterium]
MVQKVMGFTIFAAGLLAACGGPAEETVEPGPAVDSAAASLDRQVTLAAGDGFIEALQTALITAEDGDEIIMPAGTFELTDGLSLDADRVTLRGAGQSETVLNFSGQTGAGEGLLVTSDDVTLSGFTIQDTAGDGIKSKGADRITYANLTVEWTGEPDEDNGAYGVYPVESSDVLIDGVTVRGASDAGVYVGQSDRIIVRNSVAEYNVAGIEIENSSNADVYNNRAEHNAGGILVFDLPDLPVVGGHSTRIFNNQVINNNTRNFAPPGNIVASVPSGTGVIVLANRNVHVFENTFDNNRSAHVLLTAYSDPFEDDRYNPLPRDIVLRDNDYTGVGYDPQQDLADLAPLLGGSLPPVVWDGVTRWGDGPDADVKIVMSEAEDIGFLSLGLGAYPLDPANLAPTMDRPDGSGIAEPSAVVLIHDKTG